MRVIASLRSCALGILALAYLAAPVSARADRRELYTLVGYEVGLSHHQVPAGGDASATQYAGAIDLTAYYGLSNALHVGGRLRLTMSSNLRFGGVNVSNGERTTTGDAFVDERGIAVGGILVWRIDTGPSLAPVLELGAGLAVHQYRNISLFPSDGGSGVPLSSSSEAVAYGSGTVLVEYRFRKRWVAAAGVGAQVEGGRTPWSLLVPLRVGVIW